jgi:hypothetical protein
MSHKVLLDILFHITGNYLKTVERVECRHDAQKSGWSKFYVRLLSIDVI